MVTRNLPSGRVTISAGDVDAMRDWASDCVWADYGPDDIAAAPRELVIRAIERHYDGGCAQFLRDANV